MLPGNKLIRIAILLLLFLFSFTPALAGGWSVLTLDEMPQDVRASKAFTVRFMIRGHGISPASGMEPIIQATHTGSGHEVNFKAIELPEPGRYEAVMELPQEGVWRWVIDGYGKHPLPDLQVVQAAARAPGIQPIFGSAVWIAAAIMTLLLAAAFGLHQQSRKAIRPWVWGVVCLPILASGLLAFNSQALSQESGGLSYSGFNSAYAYGEALFVAKGCASCHTNTRIADRYRLNKPSIGPALSAYPTTAEFLQVWLKDPSAVRPGTRMPNLGLSDQEIEALTAFLIDK